jgi:hypothetical protein
MTLLLRSTVAFGVMLATAVACSSPESAPRASGASRDSAQSVAGVRKVPPLGRTYALARLRSFGPYVTGGQGSPVRETIDILAETLTFEDTSADSGAVIRRHVDRVRQHVAGRITLERIDTAVRTDFFKRAGDTIVFVTPGPKYTYLHIFEMRNGGDTLETYGRIVVLDRAGLERTACECYRIIQREFERLLEGRESSSPLRAVRVSESGKSAAGDGVPRAEDAETPTSDKERRPRSR